MKKLMPIGQYLIQKQWVRNLLRERTFFFNKNKWKDLRNFKKGEKVEHVYNGCGTQAWCDCGNELVHSKSFLREREVKETGFAVFDYKCSFCGVEQYRNPCVMPGIHSCDKDGRLLFGQNKE